MFRHPTAQTINFRMWNAQTGVKFVVPVKFLDLECQMSTKSSLFLIVNLKRFD